MAVLNDENLVKYKAQLEILDTQIGAWSTYLESAKKSINSSTGSTFKTKYAKGKKAATNIQTIIESLESVKKDLTKLLSDAKAFYTTSLNESKK